jgi:hypothetical protein
LCPKISETNRRRDQAIDHQRSRRCWVDLWSSQLDNHIVTQGKFEERGAAYSRVADLSREDLKQHRSSPCLVLAMNRLCANEQGDYMIKGGQLCLVYE